MNLEDPSGHFWQVLVAAAVVYVASYIYEWAVGMHDFSGTEMATGAIQNATLAMIGMGVEEKIATTFAKKAVTQGATKTVQNSSFSKNTVGAAERYIPSNIKKVEDKFLVNAHALKIDFIGQKNISRYDLYVDKDTGMLWIFGKGGKGEPIATYEYIK